MGSVALRPLIAHIPYPMPQRDKLITLLLLLPGLGAIGVLFCYPLYLTLDLSFRPEGQETGFTLEHYRAFLGSPAGWRVLGLTVELAVGTTALSVLLSVPLALVLRRPWRGNHAFRLLLLLPLAIPGLVSAVGLRLFWGDVGWANMILGLLPFVHGPVHVVFTVPGLMLFYTWLFFSFTALLTLSALEGLDPAIEEAAQVVGASGWQVLRHVLLPLATPGILAGSVLTFLEAFGAFSIPLVAGGDYRPLAVQIYTTSAVFLHWSAGSAMAAVMAAAQVLFLITYLSLLKRRWT